MTDSPASKMVRVRTPLIPQVQRLSELCRQGHTETVLRALDQIISAIEAGAASTLTPSDSALLADVVVRLERLESHQLPQGAMASTVGGDAANVNEALTQLTQRLNRIEKAIAPVIEALEKVPQVGAIPDVDVKATNDKTSTPTLPPDLKPPLSQRELSERLGQRYSYYLKKHRVKGKAHFEAWSQAVDPDGIAWTFDEPKRHRGKTSTKTLKFYPKP